MRGADTGWKEYICDADRALPEEEQTVFEIRSKNNPMGNESMSRYARTRWQNPDGTTEYDPTRLDQADIEEFQSICRRVTNYAWSSDYLKRHPHVAQRLNALGFDPEPIEDPNDMADLVRDLPMGIIAEILAAASDPIKMRKGLKKRSNSSSGSPSGKDALPSA